MTIKDVHMQALEEVGRIAKTLMDASGHAYLIQEDSGFRSKSIARDGGWTEDDDGSNPHSTRSHATNTFSTKEANSSSSALGESSSPGGASVGTESVATDQATTAGHRRRMGSIKMKREAHQESEATIKEAIDIYNSKNDLKKAVDFLIKKQFIAF